MPVFPATITVQHQVWVWNTNGDGNPVLDADGNPTGQLSAPVDRKVIGFQQLHDGRVDPISPDYVERTITDIVMEVPDGSVYKKLDRVTLASGGEQVAFEVQGRPPTWRQGLP
jgi:hypothetical protein